MIYIDYVGGVPLGVPHFLINNELFVSHGKYQERPSING